MNILLRPNYGKTLSKSTTRIAIEQMLILGITPMMTVSDYSRLGERPDCVIGELDDLLKQCDILMPIGGDGTVLNEVGNAIKFDLPIIGVNSGRIGFLTQLEVDEIEQLKRLKDNNYRISQRMLLEAVIVKDGKRYSFFALNDVVLKRVGLSATLVDLSIFNHQDLILRHRADGVIFSTPTGSTAYSLSAGGPVLSPDLEAVVITPICPYNTFRGSLVLSSDEEYSVIEEHIDAPRSFSVAVDGNGLAKVEKGDRIIIRKFDKKLKLIDLGVRIFYQKLNDRHSQVM